MKHEPAAPIANAELGRTALDVVVGLIEGFGDLFNSEGEMSLEWKYNTRPSSKPRMERLEDEAREIRTTPR